MKRNTLRIIVAMALAAATSRGADYAVDGNLGVNSNLTVMLDAHVVGALVAEGGITAPADLVVRGTNGEWLVFSANGAAFLTPLRLGGTNALPRSPGGTAVAATLQRDTSTTNSTWSSSLAFEYYSWQAGHVVTNYMCAYEDYGSGASGLYREDEAGSWHRIWDGVGAVTDLTVNGAMTIGGDSNSVMRVYSEADFAGPVLFSNTVVLSAGMEFSGNIAIGTGVSAQYGYGAIAVGNDAIGDAYGLAVGCDADGSFFGTAVGFSAHGSDHGVAVGYAADGSDCGTAIGDSADGSNWGAALGMWAYAPNDGVAVGNDSMGDSEGTAVGCYAYGRDYGTVVGFLANGGGSGAAMGSEAEGFNYGAAVGYEAVGYNDGAALGCLASAYDNGAAVGYYAGGSENGAALGSSAWAPSMGVAVGFASCGHSSGTAAGTFASGYDYGVAVGAGTYAAGLGNVALGGDDGSCPATVPYGWLGTVELGRGTAALEGGLSFRGHAIVDSNGVVVAAISATGGATGTFDTVQVGAGGLTASNATIQGDMSVLGTLVVSNGMEFSGNIAIGTGASASNGAVAVGNGAVADYDGVAVGREANGFGMGVGLGIGADGTDNGVAVGYRAEGTEWGVAVGSSAHGDGSGAAVGNCASGSVNGAALGYAADGSQRGVAVGSYATGICGVAVGYCAYGSGGAVVGTYANGNNDGAAIGPWADGSDNGAAIGSSAIGANLGVVAGSHALGYDYGVALGARADGHGLGNVALGGVDWTGTPATVPDGWTNTVELGCGEAALDGGLSFRGHGIVDSNGVLVAAISVANGATGNFDTVQVGSGGLTASNATLTGSLSVTGALTATGPVNLAASASASGYALTVGPTGADFCVPVVFHNSHVDVPTASEDDDAEAVNWGLMRDYVTDTLRCDCTCHDAITNETDTLQTVTTRGHTTTCSISIGPAGTSAGGQYAFAQGPHAVADGTGSHAEGDGSQAHGVGSHAEGCSTASADAAYAHTEGSGTALGPRSHAEGTGTETDCEASHAEGAWSEAWGDDSHAEGVLSEAWGDCSHAEGFWTEAHGTVSHAAGENAKANDDNTYVWSDGTGISSSTNEQYTVYAGNGIRLLGGETEISSTRVHGAARFESGIIYTARLGDISMGSFTNQMTP